MYGSSRDVRHASLRCHRVSSHNEASANATMLVDASIPMQRCDVGVIIRKLQQSPPRGQIELMPRNIPGLVTPEVGWAWDGGHHSVPNPNFGQNSNPCQSTPNTIDTLLPTFLQGP